VEVVFTLSLVIYRAAKCWRQRVATKTRVKAG